MKYLVRRSMPLMLLSQVPVYAANLQSVPSGLSRMSSFLSDQASTSSFFISLLLLQICLIALLCELALKFAQRRSRVNCLPPPGRSTYESPPLAGQTLYEHLISKKSPQQASRSNFYYKQDSNLIGPKLAAFVAVSLSKQASTFLSEKRIVARDFDFICDRSNADSLTEFSLSDSVRDEAELERITFNSAYFACDQICDALFSKDVSLAMQLIKSYGAVPAVMSLVERKMTRSSIDCHWRLYSGTRVGELLLKNGAVALCFRSATNRFVEAIVRKNSDDARRTSGVELLSKLVDVVAESSSNSTTSTNEPTGTHRLQISFAPEVAVFDSLEGGDIKSIDDSTLFSPLAVPNAPAMSVPSVSMANLLRNLQNHGTATYPDPQAVYDLDELFRELQQEQLKILPAVPS